VGTPRKGSSRSWPDASGISAICASSHAVRVKQSLSVVQGANARISIGFVLAETAASAEFIGKMKRYRSQRSLSENISMVPMSRATSQAWSLGDVIHRCQMQIAGRAQFGTVSLFDPSATR